jgi:glycosyltransferase involved in cell wall biosynthesis
MKISVIVPSFNQRQYLDAALRSIIEQEYPHKEIIVMDGGSIDGSVDVIRQYETHLAHWQSGADGGQSRAIYEGFSQTSAEFLPRTFSVPLQGPERTILWILAAK